MKSFASILIALVALLALAQFSSAADYYISPFGSDNNSGTSQLSAFLTLSKALSVSASGDTINAASGYYTGDKNVGLGFSERTLNGAGSSATVFQTDEPSTIFAVSGTTILSGFTLKGTSSTVAIQQTGGSTTLTDVEFTSLEQGVQVSSSTYNLTLSNCLVTNSVEIGMYFSSSYKSLENVVVESSTFSASDKAVYFYSTSSSVGNFALFSFKNTVVTSGKVELEISAGPIRTEFEGCTFSNMTLSSSESALSLELTSEISVTDSSFSNISGGNALAVSEKVQHDTSSLAVDGCRFVSNTPTRAGALSVYGTDLTLTDSLFAGNNNTYQAGALSVYHNGNTLASFTVDSCMFVGNSASQVGGAIYADIFTEDNSISNTVFAFNSAGGDGGAVYSFRSGSSISSTSFIGNTADMGGAIYLYSEVSMSGDSLSFIGNTAAYGGALYIDDSAIFEGSAVSFVSNEAQVNGGAVSNAEGTLSLEFASFTSNESPLGGGLYFIGSSANSIFAAVFKKNAASTSGGGFYCAGGGINLGFTSFTDNTAPEGSAYSCISECGTYATKVYIANDNSVSGCDSDSLLLTNDDNESIVKSALSEVPSLTWEDALRLRSAYKHAF